MAVPKAAAYCGTAKDGIGPSRHSSPDSMLHGPDGGGRGPNAIVEFQQRKKPPVTVLEDWFGFKKIQALWIREIVRRHVQPNGAANRHIHVRLGHHNILRHNICRNFTALVGEWNEWRAGPVTDADEQSRHIKSAGIRGWATRISTLADITA